MANIGIPERLKLHIANTFPGGTDAEKKEYFNDQINSKWIQYDVGKRVIDKIQNGEYPLTGNTTLKSIMTKDDAESVELFDLYMKQEFYLCVTEDDDLG